MSRKPLDKDLYDSVVAEAKRKFDVWPSAYASGWVVKTYKARGGRYGGESKGSRTGLTKWFGESWVDLSRPIREDGEVVGYEPCGRKKSGDPADYPKCRPAKEAMRMTPSEVRDAIKRKRAAEAKVGRGGRGARAPVRVATYKENPFLATEDGSPAYYSAGGVYTPGVSTRTARRDGSEGDRVEWSPDALPWFPAEGIPSPAQRMLDPAFRAWFKGSKVVDERGLPLVVWHSNNAWHGGVEARFNAFDFSKQVDLGMHFGTESAARTVGGLCRPFYLSIENPVQSPDMGAWVEGYPFSTQLPEDLLSRKKISFALYSIFKDQFEAFRAAFRAEHGDRLSERPLPRDLDTVWRHHISVLLRKLLLDAGYDGVVYENDVEDSGSISWIALHPGQIKSVENDGTWDFNDPDVRRNNPRLYEYQGEHLPPGPDDGAPLHDVESVMPDYYAHPEWYFTEGRTRREAEAAAAILAARGRPWASVWVYRAVPPGVSTINPGDWVTTVRDYAKEHLDSNLGGEGRILKAKVRAGSLFTEGNSHMEWGWWPDAEREREFERLLRERRQAMARDPDVRRNPATWDRVSADEDADEK